MTRRASWTNHFAPAKAAGRHLVPLPRPTPHQRRPRHRRRRPPQGHPDADGALVDQRHPRPLRPPVPRARRGHRHRLRCTARRGPRQEITVNNHSRCVRTATVTMNRHVERSPEPRMTRAFTRLRSWVRVPQRPPADSAITAGQRPFLFRPLLTVGDCWRPFRATICGTFVARRRICTRPPDLARADQAVSTLTSKRLGSSIWRVTTTGTASGRVVAASGRDAVGSGLLGWEGR